MSEEELENDEQAIDRKWKIRGKAMPTLIETLGLLYLGLVLLRLPISMGEIHRYLQKFVQAERHGLTPGIAGLFGKIFLISEPYALYQRS